MGCDIHAYIEHKEKDGEHWWPFGGRTNPGRNYLMFNIMAGVRGDEHELFPPRGMPADPAWEARGDNELYVIEDGTGKEENTVYRTDAESWVRSGSSQWTTAEKKWVTHPDWHSHSWLTVPELEQVFARYLELCASHYGPTALKATPTVPIEYRAVLAAMKVFHDAGEDVRLVFFFDN